VKQPTRRGGVGGASHGAEGGMPFIETDDKTMLFYNDWGTGRPVVMIHG
jgi:hypothetical protein